MPPELSKLIQDFARPRPRDWRNGGAFPSPLFFNGLLVSRFWHRFAYTLLVHQGAEAQTAEEFELFLEGFDLY